MELKISSIIKWVGILILMIGSSFFFSVLMLNIMDEFLRVNWQYTLFVDGGNTIFIQWTMGAILILEVIGLFVFYRNKKLEE